MLYTMTITTKDGSEVIEIGKLQEDNKDERTVITGIEFNIDTIDDNVRNKSNAVLAKIKICGELKDFLTERLMKIFKWSCEYDEEKWYRTIEIEVKTSNGKVIRTYIFTDVFVVDYKEIYKADGNNAESSRFELYLTQKENNLNKIDTFN
ncbi:hypothetical protein E0L01_02560 [Megamonas funiformis]|uniref:hypothetical protein n=1 Tax=Megamonas funiformis TaxID=437897 RepID=UPI00142F885D|nr:hypothetical protein [Megamonas funiformis]NJE27649.1 hypothetical protein [Megamonas funiformis]BDA10612.1 hypothetical protein MU1CBH_16400 [Megamonas funiformis]